MLLLFQILSIDDALGVNEVAVCTEITVVDAVTVVIFVDAVFATVVVITEVAVNNEVSNGDAAVTVVEADVASFHRALVTTQKQFFEPERLPGLFTL